jgi:3'-5' exoribonuclease
MELLNEKVFINELSSFLNSGVNSTFLVTKKELREDRNGNAYLRLKLADNTGAVTANVWNNAKPISKLFETGDVIRIRGKVTSYNSQLQLTVEKVRKLEEDEYDLTQYLETTSKDVKKLSEALYDYIENIKDEYLKKLLLNVFDDKQFYAKFAKAPAAKSWHHNYLGGLLEHTISVTKICDFISTQYPVNRDLLIGGALLHDIGKVWEYNVHGAIEFSTFGRLVGHIPIADEFISERSRQIDNFPRELLMKLRHLILAHHGEYEKGAARLPQTLEAIVLHHADNMDAQTVGVKQLIESVQKDDAEWSEYDRLNNRYYFLK